MDRNKQAIVFTAPIIQETTDLHYIVHCRRKLCLSTCWQNNMCPSHCSLISF